MGSTNFSQQNKILGTNIYLIKVLSSESNHQGLVKVYNIFAVEQKYQAQGIKMMIKGIVRN